MQVVAEQEVEGRNPTERQQRGMPRTKKNKVEKENREAVTTVEDKKKEVEQERKRTAEEKNKLRLERSKLRKELHLARKEERRLKQELQDFLSQGRAHYHEGNGHKASVQSPSTPGGSDNRPATGGDGGNGRATRRSPRIIIKPEATKLFR